jgi:hypothetical protein
VALAPTLNVLGEQVAWVLAWLLDDLNANNVWSSTFNDVHFTLQEVANLLQSSLEYFLSIFREVGGFAAFVLDPTNVCSCHI